MADERGDCDFGEAKVVRDTGEAVAQDVRRHTSEWRVLENLLPMVGEAAKGIVLAVAREDVGILPILAPFLEILDHWQPNRSGRRALLAINQPQATALRIGFRPHQLDHFRTPAAGQGDLANDVDRHGILFNLGGLLQHLAQSAIFGFREATVPHVVLRFAKAMRRIAVYDPGLDRIGEDATQ